MTDKKDIINHVEDKLGSYGGREMARQIGEDIWEEAHDKGVDPLKYLIRDNVYARAVIWIEEQYRSYRESLREGARMVKEGKA